MMIMKWLHRRFLSSINFVSGFRLEEILFIISLQFNTLLLSAFIELNAHKANLSVCLRTMLSAEYANFMES